MASFTAQDVKKLREMTNCGMMDCKKALTETDGDMDKAIEFLREKGLATAAKKAGRIAAEGIVKAYMNGNVGVLVEVNSETDFVAKNQEFQDFVSDVAKTVADTNPADVDALKAEQHNRRYAHRKDCKNRREYEHQTFCENRNRRNSCGLYPRSR